MSKSARHGRIGIMHNKRKALGIRGDVFDMEFGAFARSRAGERGGYVAAVLERRTGK